MPLDYSLWAEIERRMYEADVKGTESKERYFDRLRCTALGLPKSLVSKAVLKMKGQIQQTIDNKGKHVLRD